MTVPDQIKNLLVSPDEATGQALAEIDRRRSEIHRYLDFGVPAIDSYFTPQGPGDIVYWLGRPGHLKTGNAMRWARHRAKRLKELGIADRVPVYVTAEDVVGSLKMFLLTASAGISITTMARGETSDADMDSIKRQISSDDWANGDNIWFIGASEKSRKDRQPLNVETIYQVIDHMEQSTGLKPDSVFVDYLQLLDPEFGAERLSKVEQMERTIRAIKSASISVSAPWVVNAQAGRQVDDRAVKIPLEGDGQWSSLIEQSGQTVMASVRPIKYCGIGDEFDGRVVQSENDVVIALWKQKLGPANKKFWLRFAPQYNRLDAIERSMATPDYKTKKEIEF